MNERRPSPSPVVVALLVIAGTVGVAALFFALLLAALVFSRASSDPVPPLAVAGDTETLPEWFIGDWVYDEAATRTHRLNAEVEKEKLDFQSWMWGIQKTRILRFHPGGFAEEYHRNGKAIWLRIEIIDTEESGLTHVRANHTMEETGEVFEIGPWSLLRDEQQLLEYNQQMDGWDVYRRVNLDVPPRTQELFEHLP